LQDDLLYDVGSDDEIKTEEGVNKGDMDGCG
jgi:hypothetical protein